MRTRNRPELRGGFACHSYNPPMRPSFFHHLHPPTVPAEQSRWRYTLGAGGTAVLLLLVVGATGILEMFYYVPTPDGAALSVQTITYLVPFGGFVRNLHFWSAQLLLVVSSIHLARVVFTGAYAPPRAFNYLLGLALFVFSILLDFTGYMLRWDQGVQWALVVGTNLLKTIPAVGGSLYILITGASQPSLPTLLRFYAWHIFGLTLGALVLLVWHIFRIRRDGGIAVPPPHLRANQARISRNELVRREVLAMLLTGAALIILSSLRPAPIAPPIADIGSISGDPRAPWFFLWVQQMLRWGDPFIWGVLVPLAVLTLLALIPYVLPKPATIELGRWFPRSNHLAQIIFAVLALAFLLLTVIGSRAVP
jgi:quinol-cytochrome oxidoreductase complex cytochrome b subunit